MCDHNNIHEICGTIVCGTCYYERMIQPLTKQELAQVKANDFKIIYVYDETVHRKVPKAVRNGKIID